MLKYTVRILKLNILLAAVLTLSAAELSIVGRAEPRKRGPVVEISQPSENPWGFREGLKKLPKSALTEPVSIRLCVLRVQFQEDSNDRSTGSGQFDLRPEEESQWPIDPTPHNREYFESHMLAVRNYWLLVSDSLIDITYDIYPIPGDVEGYTLPDSMAYYGPSGWFGNDLGARMEGFIIDAMELAYERDHIDYTRYDDFIIFHAGSDMQNDFGSTIDPDYLPFYEGVTPSPDDLPTGYKKTYREFLPGVTGALIMPEQGSQDGQIVALNGVLAHEIGHILGLVDLYSTYNMASMVGYFSLMDNGHIPGVQLDIDGEVHSVYGAIPTYPGAWDRAFLGIEDFVEADAHGQYTITACEEFKAGTTLVKIPINDYEYYLIESRHPNPDGRAINLKADPETGVILGLIDATTEDFVPKYDFLLPGAGILIWHIDEYIAYADYVGNGFSNWDNNTLQWDFTRLFADILEADGHQDMGYYIDYGDSLDMYFSGNNSELTPDSKPSTTSNSGAATGIWITDISEQGRVMTFNYRREGPYVEKRMLTGFPITKSVLNTELNEETVYIACTYEYLLGWKGDGTRLFPGDDTLGLIGYSGDTARVDFPIIGAFDTTVFAIAVGDLDGIPPMEIAVCEASGDVSIMSISDMDSSGRLDNLFTYAADERATPIFHDLDDDGEDELILFKEYGEFVVLNHVGDIVGQGDARGEISGAVCDGSDIYILAEWDRAKLIKFNADGSRLWEIILDYGDVSQPIISDIDRDGVPDIIFTSENGKIAALSSEGRMILDISVDATGLSAPVLCDLSGNGYPDIIFSTSDKIFAVNRHGYILTGFPAWHRGDSPVFTSSPSIADIDGDGAGEIIQPSELGDLYAFDSDGSEITRLSTGASESQITIFDGGSRALLASIDGSIYLLSLDEYEDYWGFFPTGNPNRIFTGQIVDIYQSEKGIINPYIWPNPLAGRGNIRFALGGDADNSATVRIYSHDGVLVDNLEADVSPGEINEIEWNTLSIPSGIYRGIIEVGDHTETIKIAIVK